MNPFTVPYPKASQSIFSKVSFAIALSISFILIAFEPFGTASFQHPFKYWILAGYGVVVFVGSIVYFLISKSLLTDRSVDRWSIMSEVIFVLMNLIFCLVACFIYWTLVFQVDFDFSIFSGFIVSATAVAIVPLAVYFLFLYIAYRDVKYAEPTQAVDIISANEIILKSSNQSEVISTTYNDLLCIKSSDNYVIVYCTTDGIPSRYMIRNTLKNIYAQLDSDSVIQCHRSYLVNISKILDIKGNVTNSKLNLLGLENTIPVARSKVATIRNLLLTH